MKHYYVFLVGIAVVIASTAVLLAQPRPLARASTPWYVSIDGNDSNDCLSPSTRCRTINGAIEKATSGDAVHIAVGTYTGGDHEVVSIHKNITLSGGWNSDFTAQNGMSTIDGQNIRAGIMVYYDFSPAIATVDHFIIQNCRSSPYDNNGGGIGVGGVLTLNNSTVRNNTGDYGGAGIMNTGTLILNNSTVGSNTALGASPGAGIYNWAGGTVILNNTTVSGNSTSGSGGGIQNSNGTVIMNNSLAADNIASSSGADCSGTINSSGYNLIGTTLGCNFNTSTGDQLNVDPKLVSVVNLLGFYPLQDGSSAIDAGNPSGCIDNLGNPLNSDQRGQSRIGRCDIGSYEYTIPGAPAGVYPFSGMSQSALVLTVFSDPLKAVVVDSIGTPVTNTSVGFMAPATGASSIFSDTGLFTTTALTDNNGVATATTLRANGVGGSYMVSAAVRSVISPASFLLTNTVKVHLPLCFNNYCGPFFDDFSNPSSGWPVGDDQFVRSEYLNGEYRALSKQGGYLYLFRSPSCSRQSYIVETDTRWVNTPGESYGLIFGVTGNFSQYYLFYVSPDYGEYALFRRAPGGFAVIQSFTPSIAIKSGQQNNHLKVTRSNTQIILEVNHVVLGTWFDAAITGSTSAGIYSNPYSALPTSDARFDNFSMATFDDLMVGQESFNSRRGEMPFIPAEHSNWPSNVDRLPNRILLK